jgi:hypothetical protein
MGRLRLFDTVAMECNILINLVLIFLDRDLIDCFLWNISWHNIFASTCHVPLTGRRLYAEVHH